MKNMKILAWDTSTPFPSVALLEGEELIGEINLNIGLLHSSHLLPAINVLLELTGERIEDVDLIAGTIGPGSFTGIRVGLSTAKALCFALNKPFAPVISLDALAFKEIEAKRLIAAIDAKKGEVFLGEYSKGKRTSELRAMPIEELWKKGDALFIGDGAIRFRKKIEENLGKGAVFSSRSPFISYETGVIGFKIKKEGKEVNPDSINPLYLRASDAEIKK